MKAHQIGSLDVREGLGDGKLDPLIRADRPAEHDALAAVGGRPVDEPAAVADRLGGQQNPFGVPAVDDVAEPAAFLADEVLGRDLDVLKEDHV